MPLPSIELTYADPEILECAKEQLRGCEENVDKLRIAHEREHVRRLVDVALGYVRARQNPRHFLDQLDDIFLNAERKSYAEIQAESARIYMTREEWDATRE